MTVATMLLLAKIGSFAINAGTIVELAVIGAVLGLLVWRLGRGGGT